MQFSVQHTLILRTNQTANHLCQLMMTDNARIFVKKFTLPLRRAEKLISQRNNVVAAFLHFKYMCHRMFSCKSQQHTDQTQNHKFHIGRVMFGSLNWMTEQIENVYDFCTLCSAFATHDCKPNSVRLSWWEIIVSESREKSLKHEKITRKKNVF